MAAGKRAIGRRRAGLPDRYPTLSDEQRQVVRKLCGGGDSVSVIRAAAGTGKTFTLDAAREAWQADGHAVVGCALSARAALDLEDQAGIPSVTVAATKRSLETGSELPYDGVLVVDEAGMVGTRDLALLTEAAERARAKLVLVGDDRQLPEIDAGGAFHALAERLETVELTEVRRQRDPWDRDALDALRNGDIERWARSYREHGRITVADNAADARAALVNDWSRTPGEAIMIAARRADVRDLNDRARASERPGPPEQGRAGDWRPLANGTVSNLQITAVQATLPSGTSANRRPVIAQYERELTGGLKAFATQLDRTKPTPGSPVYSTIHRAIEEHVDTSPGAAGPLVIAALTDGIAVERTDRGRLIDLRARTVDRAALREITTTLARTVENARIMVSVLIVGFGANSRLGDARINQARAILTRTLNKAGIAVRFSRNEVPADPTEQRGS